MEYVNHNIESLLTTDVDVLKYKVIKEYFKLVNKLSKGRTSNYQNILEMISLIDIYTEIDKAKYYKEFYINGYFE